MQQPPPGPPEEGPSEPTAPPPPPMQPPPPTPDAPAPMAPPPAGYSQPAAPATGMNRQTGSVIAYVLWWVTGIIMLFVGKDDPEIKFNAAQSIIFFGSISVIGEVLRYIPFVWWIGGIIWLFGVIVWIILLIRVSQAGGNRVEVPLFGPVVAQYAERLANAV